MNNWLRQISKVKLRIVLPILVALSLAGCGSSGSCSDCSNSNVTPSSLSLTLTAPTTYPAGVPVTAYLTLTNTSGTNANNLVFATPDATNYTGTVITVENGADQDCRNISAGGQCTFPVVLTNTPVSHPGSFTVTATPQDSSTASSAFNSFKSLIGLQATTLSLTANIGLIDVPVNTNSGANGLTFLYAQTVAANANGSTLVSIVAIVNSATAGAFNTINLTDAAGDKLNFEALSGNSGSMLSDLGQNSVVSFLLTIPAGATSLQFYGQTVKNGNFVDQGTNPNTITLASAGSGVLNVQPTQFALTHSYESQVITYSNIGNGPISSLVIQTPTNPLVMVSTTCGSSLESGASCIYIVKSNAEVGTSGSGSILTNYMSNGQANSASAQYTYAGLVPVEGVTISSGDNPTLSFTANTVNGVVSSQISLTNSGNVSESNFVFNVPQYFLLGAGTSGTPCTLVGTTVTNVLDKNDSCTLTLTYSNATLLNPSQQASLLLDYYFKGTPATQVSKTLTYQTNRAAALLQVSSPTLVNESYAFTSIIANNAESLTQIFTLTNVGSDTATGLSVAMLSGISGFSIVTGASDECDSSSTLAPNDSCSVTIKFGPVASDNTGVKQNGFSLSYTPYSSAATISTTTNLSGTALAPLSANVDIRSAVFAPTPAFGNGESTASAYNFESSTSVPTLVLTYVNYGKLIAQQFTVTVPSTPGYTLTSGGNQCVAVNLAVGATCTVTFSLNINTLGAKNLTLTGLSTSWVDQTGTVTSSSVLINPNFPNGQPVLYTSVYATPTVTALLSSESTGATSTTNVAPNTDFYAVFKLTGGANFSQIYSVTPSGNVTVVGSPSCTLSSGTPTCSVKLNSGAASGSATTVSFGGTNPAPSPTSINVNVAILGKLIFSTYYNGQGRDGNFGGIAGVDAGCMEEAALQSLTGVYKALVSTTTRGRPTAIVLGNNWPLESSARYVNTSGTLIGVTSESRVFASASVLNAAGSDNWTGFDNSFTYDNNTGSYNCRDWTSTVGGFFGYKTSGGAPSAQQCGVTNQLYCVEQAPAGPNGTATLTLSAGTISSAASVIATITITGATASDPQSFTIAGIGVNNGTQSGSSSAEGTITGGSCTIADPTSATTTCTVTLTASNNSNGMFGVNVTNPNYMVITGGVLNAAPSGG